MSSNEFDRSNPHAINFNARSGVTRAGIEFDDIDLTSLTDHERTMIEKAVAGFTLLLRATINSREALSMIGLNLGNAFEIIFGKLREANRELNQLDSEGHSRMG